MFTCSSVYLVGCLIVWLWEDYGPSCECKWWVNRKDFRCLQPHVPRGQPVLLHYIGPILGAKLPVGLKDPVTVHSSADSLAQADGEQRHSFDKRKLKNLSSSVSVPCTFYLCFLAWSCLCIQLGSHSLCSSMLKTCGNRESCPAFNLPAMLDVFQGLSLYATVIPC